MNKPNRVALSGQPCRKPIEGVIPSPVKPETLTDSKQLSYKNCTAPIILQETAIAMSRSYVMRVTDSVVSRCLESANVFPLLIAHLYLR